jgi:ABC-2 type transport system permease protein
MEPLVAQARAELQLVFRNGEQLLVTLGIPVLLLVFFSLVEVLPTGDTKAVDFLVPGVLALAVMSTAMVSLGIATGFERSYQVLKRLGATPLGRGRLVLAKVLTVAVVEVVQLAVLVPVAFVLGWEPTDPSWIAAFLAIVLGTAAFGGIGLLLAGTLRGEVNLAAQNGLYLVLLLVGGIIVPLDDLPIVLRVLARLSPSGALAQVLRDAVSMGDSGGAIGWIVLGIWAVISPLVAIRFFRWT